MHAAKATSVSTTAQMRRHDRYVLIALVGVALLRSLALFATPLELGVDEAQYWLWSQNFDFGYYTKPPMTSWIIALTHGLLGHESWAVRIAAPWLHLGTGLMIWQTARWLYGDAAGRWGAVLWMVLPAVSLGSFIMSTDTPLLFFWSAALMFVVGTLRQKIAPTSGMALAGVMIGGGMLAKYAAVYFAVGIVLFWVWQRRHRRSRPSPDMEFGDLSARQIGLLLAGMLLAASPNLGWNLLHDFATVRHLGDNANLAKQSFSLAGSAAFLGAQFITAGPLCFALMLLIIWPRQSTSADRLLICLSVPPLALMSLQAFVSEANANWALTAMPALVVWLSGWITRDGWRWGLLSAGINGGIALIFLAVSAAADMGPLTPKSDPLRRLKGWSLLADDVDMALTASGARTVITDRRASAALLNWHFHQRDVSILIDDTDGIPSNHFEANYPWTSQPGRQILMLSGAPDAPALDSVEWMGSPAVSDVVISDKRRRIIYLHHGRERPDI
mgnify:FL=1